MIEVWNRSIVFLVIFVIWTCCLFDAIIQINEFGFVYIRQVSLCGI